MLDRGQDLELIIEVDLARKLVFPNVKLNNIPARGRVIVSPKNITEQYNWKSIEKKQTKLWTPNYRVQTGGSKEGACVKTPLPTTQALNL